MLYCRLSKTVWTFANNIYITAQFTGLHFSAENDTMNICYNNVI